MNYQQIIPVTEARPILGSLVDQVSGDEIIGFTKSGRVRAVLVDSKYFDKLTKISKTALQKTYFDPKVDKYVREFTDKEIAEWLKEDAIVS